jgi:hypothetical protein
MTPLVSILIPAYNAKRWIDEMIILWAHGEIAELQWMSWFDLAKFMRR